MTPDFDLVIRHATIVTSTDTVSVTTSDRELPPGPNPQPATVAIENAARSGSVDSES
jgi:hypothetical protein